MTDPIQRISEPLLPEHQLLREVASMPQLSRGLRDRVLVDVRRQVRYGRWADRLRIAAAVLAASLLVGLVWHFRWTGQHPVANRAEKDPVVAPAMPAPQPTKMSASDTMPADPRPPALPHGGPSSRPEMKELQQLNQLIEKIQGRNNALCGLTQGW